MSQTPDESYWVIAMNWGSMGAAVVTAFIGSIAAATISTDWSTGRGDNAQSKELLTGTLTIAGFLFSFVFTLIASKFAGGGFLRSLGVSVVSILALAVLVSLVTKRVNYS
ncbi:MAG TPA: hypothetical protein VGL53_17310, partial [Bryobacteraceae bacterium]